MNHRKKPLALELGERPVSGAVVPQVHSEFFSKEKGHVKCIYFKNCAAPHTRYRTDSAAVSFMTAAERPRTPLKTAAWQRPRAAASFKTAAGRPRAPFKTAARRWVLKEQTTKKNLRLPIGVNREAP